MDQIRFDDLPTLKVRISQEYGPWSDSKLITEEIIKDFADTTGDQQWIHVDVERAQRESPFGNVIAHGFLLLGMSTVIKNSADYRIVEFGKALSYGLENVRFISPVVAGSRIHGRTRLCDVQEEKGGVMLTVEVAIHVVDQEKPAVKFQWKLLYLP